MGSYPDPLLLSSSPTLMEPPPPWNNLIPALTHILTHPTTTPSLHSQLFIATRLPSHLQCDHYPPILSPPPNLLRWSLTLFLRRSLSLNQPPTSWRSKCPFQQPPPLVLSIAVDPAPARWGPDERRAYARKRMRRGRLGIKLPPLLAVVVPNVFVLSLLVLNLDPLWRKK